MRNSKEKTPLEVTKGKWFTRALLKWFKNYKRDFPWREHGKSAYRLALAESLLQKTSATNALPVYERVIERYPTVQALAATDLETLSEMLRPLGLPRRAILLHQLAVEITSNHSGNFPETEAELQKLPGIGPYGAGAIASQAFSVRAPMIDINVMRIFHRVFSTKYTPRSGPSKELRELVLALMPKSKQAEFNLALLDFGALVCRSRDPQHDNCPLAELCDYNIVRMNNSKQTKEDNG